MAIRRNSKKHCDDPFRHTNLTTLCGSIPEAMKALGMSDILKSQQDSNIMNLIVGKVDDGNSTD